MELSAASVSFEVLPLESIAVLVREMGFTKLDLFGHARRAKGHLEPEEIAAQPTRVADRVRRLTEQLGLSISDFFPTFGVGLEDRAVNTPDDATRRSNRELFERLVDFARQIGCPGITLSPGVVLPGMLPGEAFERSCDVLRELVAVAGEQGVALRVEPHVGSVLPSPEATLEMVRRVPGLKLSLDYSHFAFLYVPFERVHALIPHADHFHLRAAKHGHLQTSWQENEIPFGDIFHRLHDAGFRGSVALEYVCQDWYGANRIDVLHETVVTKDAVLPLLTQLV